MRLIDAMESANDTAVCEALELLNDELIRYPFYLTFGKWRDAVWRLLRCVGNRMLQRLLFVSDGADLLY